MVTLGATTPTLADLAKQMDPDGKPARVINILKQKNQVLTDMTFIEGNLKTGHQVTVQTGLPDATWRKLNGGVIPSTDSTAQLTEQCGMLETWSQVDVKLAKMSGNVDKYRMQRAKPRLEGLSQEAAGTMWYGTRSTKEEIIGFAERYSVLSGAPIAQNVIDCGGTGSDLTSMYIAGWGEETVTGIYPEGSNVGIDHMNYGETVVENAGGVTGALMAALRERWSWDFGLALVNWQYAARACNIDVSDLVDEENGAADLVKILTKMYHRMPDPESARFAIYMNRTLFQMLDIQRQNKVSTGGGITWDNVDGKVFAFFRGIPIRPTDSLLNTEDQVV